MIEIIIAFTLLVCGTILTFRLKFYKPHILWSAFSAPFSDMKNKRHDGISPFSALCTALGGCIGTGNIIGVTSCITLGGIGSVFWIWLGSLTSMATKYAEVYLSSLSSKEIGVGSPFHYIKIFLGKSFMPLAYLWCILCFLSAIFTGGSVQANAVSESVLSLFPANFPLTRVRLICGIILSIIVFIMLIGGLKRISSLSTALVPIMCIFYVMACVVCVIASGSDVLLTIKRIIGDAMKPRSVITGGTTYAFLHTLQLGVSRGIFSNEAGMGTSSLALGNTSSDSPHAQGGLGMWEIVIDSFIVCTVTALLVITCVPDDILFDNTISPVFIVNYAFSSVFPATVSRWILPISLIIFAFTSILGWSYYGLACSSFLCKRHLFRYLYTVIFCTMLTAGCMFPLGIIWDIAATANMVLALPNVMALLLITQKKRL